MPQEGYASAEYYLHHIFKLLNGGSSEPSGGGAAATSFVEKGAPNIATGHAVVAVSAGMIIGGRATRRAVLIINHGTTDVYLGSNTPALTTATGVLLTGTEGAAISIPTTAAIWAIVGVGSQEISFIEVYD